MNEAQRSRDEIDRDTPIAVVMRQWPATVRVLVKRKMACAGCALAPFCTIDDVARDYAVEVEPLLEAFRWAATRRFDGMGEHGGLGLSDTPGGSRQCGLQWHAPQSCFDGAGWRECL